MKSLLIHQFIPFCGRCIFYIAILTTTLLSIYSCDPRKIPEPQVITSAYSIPDSTEFHVDLLLIDSIYVTFAHDLQNDTFIHEKDWSTLAEHMVSCNYDTFRNQNNAHITVVPPDYTLSIRYKETPPDHKDWLLLWEEGGVARFRNTWFRLPEASQTPLYNLLYRYKQ